jgi:hypothetical protein
MMAATAVNTDVPGGCEYLDSRLLGAARQCREALSLGYEPLTGSLLGPMATQSLGDAHAISVRMPLSTFLWRVGVEAFHGPWGLDCMKRTEAFCHLQDI